MNPIDILQIATSRHHAAYALLAKQRWPVCTSDECFDADEDMLQVRRFMRELIEGSDWKEIYEAGSKAYFDNKPRTPPDGLTGDQRGVWLEGYYRFYGRRTKAREEAQT